MADTNHPDYFPELRFHTFESYAHKWAEARDENYNFDLRYPFINCIILYRVPVAYDYKQKYLLFFELSEITDEQEKIFPQMLESPGWLINCFGELEDNFKEIYKKEPDQNYLNEWAVVTKRPEDVVEKHSWMLFSRTDKEKKIKEKTTKQAPDADDFIKSLRVFYENDYEIKVQVPGRKADCFTCQSLGFRDKETKTWKDLINILKSRPHTYDVGAAYKYLFYDVDRSHRLLHSESGGEDTRGYKELIKTKDFRVKMYDRKRKRLLEINKKLIKFFHKQYSVKFPKNYKLYEQCEEDGVYKFKFNVMLDDGTRGFYESRYESYPKDRLVKEMEFLAQKYRNKQSGGVMYRFSVAAKFALSKKWLSNDEIEDMIKN